MERVNLQFLDLFKSSLNNKPYECGEIDLENLKHIYALAQIHHVVPMIYNALYNEEFFENVDENFKRMFKNTGFRLVVSQIQRSNRFLELYKKLQENDVDAIVFKGIIFRNMYNNPDDRMSSDEDILVKKEDYDKVKEIFLGEGLEFIQKEGNECAYFCRQTGLCIEVSTSLFSDESKAYGHLNNLFDDIFEKSIKINIDGVEFSTLSHEQHLIYIVFHNMKHFLHGGFGIRQVADFMKYIEKYGEFIDWDKFWSDLKILNYDTFALNLIDISLKYLGFDDNKAVYPGGIKNFDEIKNYNDYYINSDDLISDILDSGVFGASTQERKHTALMTLNAVEENDNGNNGNRFKAIFPSVDYLKGSYTYLQKYPVLLPVAWGQRILGYLKKNKNNKDSYVNTMELGKQRIELLKEYKIIK
ncbi:MAG: nucleotidyltransferase family protein [Intestinibacter bartlettii]|uniref:nucleotidyltransferase domain-containing protein n=1 Tax=Intestinibacter bartlettii TaxID=261299 RepID=UPI0026F1B58B|nr:nucleotidyltransferase family protein [Intestinibacter bartlettii]MDO5011364.1 nucleotidyltransferase family protein [Intestinibacter bartlettii]